jgi:hypothetical protein
LKRDLQAVAQVVLGALAGSAAHTIQAAALSDPRHLLLSPIVIPYWLWVAQWALAPAIGAIVLVRAAARWGRAASAAASAVALAGSYPFFIWYMGEMSPRVGWERAWLLPLVTVGAVVALFWLDVPRAKSA